MLLTMIPYLYYCWGGRYKEHYILGQLNGDMYFSYAAVSAFVFIVMFFMTYRLAFPVFSTLVSRVSLDISYSRLIFLLSCGSVVIFAFVVLLSYRYSTGVFAFIAGLDYHSVAVKRNELSQGGGILKLNKLFMKSWVPMHSYLFFYVICLLPSIRPMHKFFLAVSVVSGVFASLFFLEKAVLFLYVFGFVGVYVYAGRSLKVYYIVFSFLLALALVSIMYMLTYGDRIVDFVYLKNIILHRVMTQSVGSVMAFDYFSTFEFKGMAGVSNFWASLNNEVFSSPYADIIKYYVPETADISGALSSFVTGEAYGLFGLYGVFASGMIIAFWYAFFEATKYSKALSVIFVGVYGLYFSHPYVASSFFGFVWPLGLLYNILPFVLLLIFSLNFKVYFSKIA